MKNNKIESLLYIGKDCDRIIKEIKTYKYEKEAKSMEIICKTENYIATKTTCEKRYCCKKLKTAMEILPENKYTDLYSRIRINEKNQIILETHGSYRDSFDNEDIHDMRLFFCPFCGKKLMIKRVKVDKTKELPVKEKIIYKEVEVEKKKKHWWNFNDEND